MNDERMTYLLTYLDGLAKLTANDYRCNTEIGECIGMIREELTKVPDITTVEVKQEANGTFYRVVTPNE